MLKKTIKYEDFDGNELSEDFYFNITNTELSIIKNDFYGESLEKLIAKIKNTSDEKTTIDVFRKVILFAYGKKSEDGKRFIKSDELSKEFEQTLAFDALFTELGSDENAAKEFIQSILPKQKK